MEIQMSSSKPPLALVPKGAAATEAEILMLELRALKPFRGLSSPERMRKTNAIIDGLRPMAMVAAEIAGLRTPALVARVDKLYDEFVPVLKELSTATNDARLLLDVIHAAECRVAVALASLEDGRTRR
jgi:hypothetical protein